MGGCVVVVGGGVLVVVLSGVDVSVHPMWQTRWFSKRQTEE